jgi:hypothetical protein
MFIVCEKRSVLVEGSGARRKGFASFGGSDAEWKISPPLAVGGYEKRAEGKTPPALCEIG